MRCKTPGQYTPGGKEPRKTGAPSPEQIYVTEKEMTKKVFALAWPATVEAVLQTTIQMVTSSLLGHIPGYSALAVSASGLADRATRLSWALFAAVGTGATVMIARSVGAGDKREANSFAGQAMVLGAFLMAVMTAILLIFPEQLINGLYNRNRGMSAELVSMTIGYLRIVAWSVPLMGINQVISALMRGAGNTKVTLVTNTAANVTNAVLGYALIYGNLGFPAMGITGAGIAAIISQGVGAAAALFIFIKIQDYVKVTFRRFKLQWSKIKAIFGVGVPHASEQLFFQFGQIAIMGLIGSMGDIQLAAHTQGITAESISYMPAMGFGIAATTLVSMSVGAGSVSLAKRYVRILAKWDMILTAATASFLIFAPKQVFGLLSNDADVVALGSVYLMIMGFCQFPQQLTGVLAGALRGGGDSKATLFNSMVGLWAVRIPLSFLFVNAFGMGITGVWWAMAIDLVTRFILTIIRYTSGKWEKRVTKA
ncbi:MAG: MATE family efflux transporter [Clostridiales bacterium]|jgi:putative MATE family efflux protein|nr:MATE family efflux transporter [Clostridiales bacterium]